MKEYARQIFTGERALFCARDIKLYECTFEDGESPLKEGAGITAQSCAFRWKYPLWYCNNVKVENSTLFDTARAGIWYTHDIAMNNCIIEAPKTFRRSTGIKLADVAIPNALETLWGCEDVELTRVTARGDYLAMNGRRFRLKDCTILSNYCFDGAEDVEIENCRLLAKDAFWNSANVIVKNSYISGEYLAWNARNITFENCTIESLQGLCYVKGLKLINCRLVNTTLAFEYSEVEADISGCVDSVKNPSSGSIVADGYGEIIMERDKVDVSATRIEVRGQKDDMSA